MTWLFRGIGAAALAAALLLGGLRAVAPDGFGAGLEDAALDLRFALRGARPAPDTVLVVTIDDAALARIGLMGPMRAALGDALARLTEGGAAAIVVDLLLVEPTPADAALAAALAASPAAVLAVAVAPEARAAGAPTTEALAALARSAFRAVTTDHGPGAVGPEKIEAGNGGGAAGGQRDGLSGDGTAGLPAAEPLAPDGAGAARGAAGGAGGRPPALGHDGGPPRAALLAPAAPLVAAAPALGHVNLTLSADRVARRAPLATAGPGGLALPSAALVAARLALGAPPSAMVLRRGAGVSIGPRFIATDPAGQVVINHYGGRGAVATLSFGDLLDGRAPPEALAGRAVFIGAGVESLRDMFATPFAPDVAGAEVLATLAANLIAGETIETGGRLRLRSVALALLGAAAAGVAAVAPASPVMAAAATAAVWAAAAAALHAAFAANLALDAVTVLGATLVASGLHWPARLAVDRRGHRLLARERAALARFLSPFAAAALGGRTAGRPGGPAWRTEPATIAFVDLAGSVGLTESLRPEEAAVLLHGVQDRIARAAARHGGAVVERFGDGALVAFGFGGGGPRDALGFAAAVAGASGPPLRVSLQHGPVALADLGGDGWGHVSVAGDTVNVASRLQDAAKRAGVRVVAGRAVLDAAGLDDAARAGPGLRRLPPEDVRGRRGGVEVWALDRPALDALGTPPAAADA